MNTRDRIRKELENDAVWKQLTAAVTPEQLAQVNSILDDFFAVAGSATDGFTTSFSKEKITDEQVAAAIGDRKG